jgi:hypothetical protein
MTTVNARSFPPATRKLFLKRNLAEMKEKNSEEFDYLWIHQKFCEMILKDA